MQVKINFKKPGVGMGSMFLKIGEKLQFYRGRARRLPKDPETVFNTVPVKHITSIEVQDEPKQDLISFTPEKLVVFKKLYEATEDGKTFMFEGREVLKEYAKYMIEYLEPKLAEAK